MVLAGGAGEGTLPVWSRAERRWPVPLATAGIFPDSRAHSSIDDESQSTRISASLCCLWSKATT